MKKGDAIEGTPYVASRTFKYPLAEGESASLTHQVTQLDPMSTEYRLAERGSLQISLKNQRIQTIPIYDKTNPLLQVPEKATFSFQASSPYKDTLLTRYGYICRMLVQELFHISGSKWAD
ncbi:hypothetical protein D3C85_1418820 [compost metagenome]